MKKTGGDCTECMEWVELKILKVSTHFSEFCEHGCYFCWLLIDILRNLLETKKKKQAIDAIY